MSLQSQFLTHFYKDQQLVMAFYGRYLSNYLPKEALVFHKMFAFLLVKYLPYFLLNNVRGLAISKVQKFE